ncbi:glycoside hydrolase family 76 protein [Streptomyces sp. NPDC091271]|uniref:glycoside hydrolase family 76 protein n=1 Tax=Streptomyces sp. NPDC091271 TaxID=3365980 RepID=UPI003826F753
MRTHRPLLAVLATAVGLCLVAAGPATARPGADRHQDAVAAVDGLMTWWNPDSGDFDTTGWWNNANDLQALLDFWQAPGDTGGHDIEQLAAEIYDKNVGVKDGQFRNDYLDDTGWWGLAWLKAFDLTGDRRYLDTAIADANHMWAHHDSTCGGGIWWNYAHQYKNTITNELFIALSAGIHNRLDGDTTHLARAQDVWDWFQAKKLINGDDLVNDGLNTECVNTGRTATWTYNQGVILGGLVELHRATGDASALAQARRIAEAVIASPLLAPGGILSEPDDDATDGGADGPSFKGAFMRNLGALDRALPDRPYSAFIDRQADALRTLDRSGNFYGFHWNGPFDKADAARQHSALDALTAAVY